MLADELYSVIHVPCLKDENAAELFLGFRVGTVGGCHFAVLPVNGQRGFRRLERFSASPVPVGAKMVIVIKACVEHGVLFSRGHALEFAFVVVPETDVFHCSSPLPSSQGGSRQQSVAPARSSRHCGSCSEAAMERLFTCFRRVLVSEPGGKESRAPHPTHGRRRRPCAPTPAPRPYQRLQVSRNRLCALWSRWTARR